MFLSDLSIKRPVFATMMIMALVVLGLRLPATDRSPTRRLFPNSDSTHVS